MSTTPMSFLPTPPFTPTDPTPHRAHLLTSLITHYQHERMWVKHTQDMISVARHQLQFGSSTPSVNATATKSARVPLWQRRKSRQRLYLNEIGQVRLSKRLLAHNGYGNKVLDSFAALLDARIESCKRMESLIIQSAHSRRHLRSRGVSLQTQP